MMNHPELQDYDRLHHQKSGQDLIDPEMQLLYNLTEPTEIDVDTEAAWLTLQDQLVVEATPTRQLYWTPILKSAAAVLFVAFLGFFTYQFSGLSSDTVSYQIEQGKKKIRLPDGSQVWLNEGSSISFTKGFKGGRAIDFEGEAYFEIEKNKGTFTITTPETSVEVLGTAFNLNTQTNKQTRLSLTEGVVNFSAGQKTTQLTAGQMAIYHTESKELSTTKKLDINDLSWRTGRFDFTNLPFQEVVNYLNGYYESDIQLASKKIGNCKVTGTFDKMRISEILEEIALILELEISRKDNSFSLSGEGC